MLQVFLNSHTYQSGGSNVTEEPAGAPRPSIHPPVGRGASADRGSRLRQQRLELELLTRLPLHEDLRCPTNQPGFAAHGEKG